MKRKFTVFLILVAILISIQAIPFFISKTLDLGFLHNYEEPQIPSYVFNEEVHTDEISDEISTLGRVLFYDNHLSLNETISCASCHKQEFAFGDTLVASPGFDKKTNGASFYTSSQFKLQPYARSILGSTSSSFR